MSEHISSNEALAAWLVTKPADAAYSYFSTKECMIHQYLTSKGVDVSVVTYENWEGGNGLNNPLPPDWDAACRGSSRLPLAALVPHPDWTFGQALERLQLAMAAKEPTSC